jgi:hypothetical protein
VTHASEFPPIWSTCEAVLSEAFHLLGRPGTPNLSALLRRRTLSVAFELAAHVEPVMKLIERYSDVPMSLADACLVRMTETLAWILHGANESGDLRNADSSISNRGEIPCDARRLPSQV